MRKREPAGVGVLWVFLFSGLGLQPQRWQGMVERWHGGGRSIVGDGDRGWLHAGVSGLKVEVAADIVREEEENEEKRGGHELG